MERVAGLEMLGWLIQALQHLKRPLLFGLRLWAAVSMALFMAFWLELENASWAGTSAALVCQPRLGASMRKGWFRMIGTLVGAILIVLLTAAVPQNRPVFLIGLAFLCGASAFVAMQLRNAAAYAATMVGTTAAIVAGAGLGAIGGPNGEALMLAISRATEIWIGIVSAGIVLASTDFGEAPRRLEEQISGLATEIRTQIFSMLSNAGNAFPQSQLLRRDLARRIIALNVQIDEAIGESSRLRYNSPLLQRAIEGLLQTLTSWRIIAVRLSALPVDLARQQAWRLQQAAPLFSQAFSSSPPTTIQGARSLRSEYSAGARALVHASTESPSLRLLLDEAARIMAGFCHTLDGIALLQDDPKRRASARARQQIPTDLLPGLVAAVRAFVAVLIAEGLWIVTEWPSGSLAIVWTALAAIVFATSGDEPYERITAWFLGTVIAAACAAVMAFAILPNVHSFVGLSLVLGLYLVPMGALSCLAWKPAMFGAMATLFVPLLNPANQMSYDTAQFYNASLALIVGCGIGALAYHLLPPLSPFIRTRRLLRFTLRDFRSLCGGNSRTSRQEWETLMYSRLAVIPDTATPQQRSELVAAFSLGLTLITLRRTLRALHFQPETDLVLSSIAKGAIDQAREGLQLVDRALAGQSPVSKRTLVNRTRGLLLVLGDGLSQHAAYFGCGMHR